LVAYAGADGPFAPEVKGLSFIEAIMVAVESKPVNVLLLDSSMNVANLAAAAWVGLDKAALSVRDDGHLPAAKGVNHG